jgi:hypothetical protein
MVSSPAKLLAEIDSSSDEEVERSVSYRVLSEQRNDRLRAYGKKHPKRSTVHMACKDVWSDGKDKLEEGEGGGPPCHVVMFVDCLLIACR